MTETPSRFAERQNRFFEEADVAHFIWQTEHPYIARTERELVRELVPLPGQAVLEVGCGEGANLVNLLGGNGRKPRLTVGLDLFLRKLVFAQQRGVPGRFVCGTAFALPFRDAAFDLVLCRDVLHHLEDPEQALYELHRVARPGGHVWIVEPNGRNPLVAFLSLVRPHERGQLRNSVGSMGALVNRVFHSHRLEVRQPLPLYRMLLHYEFGWPGLGRTRAGAALLNGCEAMLRAIWPRSWWAYIVVRAERE